MKKTFFLLAIAIVLGLTVQSCREMGIDPWDGGGGNGDGDPKDTTHILPIEKLIGTKWQLTAISSTNLDGSVETTTINQQEHFISLAFDAATRVNGSNICNGYSATVHSAADGSIKFTDIFSTDAYCGPGLPDAEYMNGLNHSTTYTSTGNELRINYSPEVSIPEIVNRTLVFAPLTSGNNGGGNGGDNISPEAQMRIKQLTGRGFTLYSFVNANMEEVLTDSKKCTIEFMPYNAVGGFGANGTAIIQAECNTGSANLSFNDDATEMKLDNISMTKMACENPATSDRFVEYLRNTGRFEVSDNGTTLTIWTSLQTFAESKMVLKVAANDPVLQNLIEIQNTPPAGVPTGTYDSFILNGLKNDGKYIYLSYSYNGKTDDYRISAYSTFEFGNTMLSTVFVDLVADGTANPLSVITNGEATLSLDAIRSHRAATNTGSVLTTIIFRYKGNTVGQAQITL